LLTPLANFRMNYHFWWGFSQRAIARVPAYLSCHLFIEMVLNWHVDYRECQHRSIQTMLRTRARAQPLRFYARDMLHPSELAVDYVWHRLLASRFSPAAQATMQRVAALAAAATHRPFNPLSATHQKFLRAQLEIARALEAEVSGLDLRGLRGALGAGVADADAP
jgi:hypothetical protein